jgi:hypothetical protein
MTPNLLLATQKVFQPHKWFRASKSDRPTRVTEYWSTPEPGQYEYIPGRGWYLISKLKFPLAGALEPIALEDGQVPASSSPPREFEKCVPVPVHRSRVLGRYLLEDDYKSRKKTTHIKDERGVRVQAGFFRLDNEVAWVHCWNEDGKFIPGGKTGYKLWCIDSATNEFRHMRKGDDPDFVRSRHTSASRDRESETRSQDSVSTTLRSGPGSTRDGLSVPSTRASSIRGGPFSPTSTSSSRVQSRRSSPIRNNSIPFEEAKAALRRMAKEQEEAVAAAAAAAARTRTNSKEDVPRVERGRAITRIAT